MTGTATGEAALLGRHTWPDPTVSVICGAGGCWVPNKAWPGIVFSHWGRLEVNHTSNTDYGPDDYSKPFVSADMDGDWRDAFKGHPCFNPKKVRRPSGQCAAAGGSGGRKPPSSRLPGSAQRSYVPLDLHGLSAVFLALALSHPS